MIQEKEIVCINCPVGCRLKVKLEEKSVLSVDGNMCKRGEEFACTEAVNPVRIMTSLMRVEGRDKPISVKTQKPIPKNSLRECADYIFKHPLPQDKLPIRIGDVVIQDICGYGVDILSTQNIER